MDRYTTLAARQMFEDGRRAGWIDVAVHPPAAFLRNYVLRGGFRDGMAGLIISVMNAYYVGLKFAKLWELCSPSTSTPPGPGAADRTRSLLTVLGLRALGHRAVLVAHPDGELYRRAAEGPDLVPLAPRNEVDLSRGVEAVADPQAVAAATSSTPTIRTPWRWRRWRCRSARRRQRPALVASRRVDFHLQGNSFSRWKYRQVDCFIAASEAIRHMLVADGIPAARIVVVHDGIDVARSQRLPGADLHDEYLAAARRAGASSTSARWCAHKGQKYLIEADAAWCCARCRTRGS